MIKKKGPGGRGYIPKKKDVKCHYCGINIENKRTSSYHVNIMSNPRVNYFCSVECKNKWIYKRDV